MRGDEGEGVGGSCVVGDEVVRLEGQIFEKNLPFTGAVEATPGHRIDKVAFVPVDFVGPNFEDAHIMHRKRVSDTADTKLYH